MTAQNYANCLRNSLKWEGGYANDPQDDDGGGTMRGVTTYTYNDYRDRKGLPRRDVRKITEQELQDIYENGYWLPVQGPQLEPGVDQVMLDYSINSGPSRPNKALQRILGGLTVDGGFGPKTLKKYLSNKGKGEDLIEKIMGKRVSFLKSLRIFSRFGRGWMNRCADIEAKALAMWFSHIDTQTGTGTGQSRMEEQARKANRKAKSQGTGSAAGGASAPVAVQGWENVDWVAVGVFGALLAAAVFLGARSYINFQRSKAIKEEVKTLKHKEI